LTETGIRKGADEEEIEERRGRGEEYEEKDFFEAGET
jgi:hypothetical protein